MQVRIDPAPMPGEDTFPLVSVIVPVRNEARNIRRCVPALLSQTYPHLEVIVVDDRSTDTSPVILDEMLQENQRESGKAPLRVLHGEDLPPAWAGKPHALHQGAAIAQGEWLCFVDADTFAAPELIASTWSAACRLEADLLSILTDQELGSFWERVILPLVFTALSVGFPASRVNDPTRPDAIANGQFILIRRPVYYAVGGHQAVRLRIDEDKALAEHVKGAGYRLLLADGRRLARTRMYTSLVEIWEGWTKNIFVGLRDRLWLLLLGAITGLLGALALPLWLALSLVWLAGGGGLVAAICLAQAMLVWVYLLFNRVQACLAFRISPWYALTLPLGALIFTAMMIASTLKVITGRGVTWKGRTYSGTA